MLQKTPANELLAINLMAAKALIDTPSKWCQGRLTDNGSKRMCALNAFARSLGYDDIDHSLFSPVMEALRTDPRFHEMTATFVSAARGRIVECVGPGDICEINNVFSHGDLMAIFDAAIAVASGGKDYFRRDKQVPVFEPMRRAVRALPGADAYKRYVESVAASFVEKRPLAGRSGAIIVDDNIDWQPWPPDIRVAAT